MQVIQPASVKSAVLFKGCQLGAEGFRRVFHLCPFLVWHEIWNWWTHGDMEGSRPLNQFTRSLFSTSIFRVVTQGLVNVHMIFFMLFVVHFFVCNLICICTEEIIIWSLFCFFCCSSSFPLMTNLLILMWPIRWVHFVLLLSISLTHSKD